MQLLAKFKKIMYMEFRATLNFRKFNSMRWLGLFTNKTFRKHRKLIFPGLIGILSSLSSVSLAIFHPHFVIRIFLSAFYHPHFPIRILSSAFFYLASAIRRHPVHTLQRPSRKRGNSFSAVADQGEGSGGPAPLPLTLFWVKKEKNN